MVTRTTQQTQFEALVREAISNHQGGRLAEAERLYREVLARKPDFAEIHINLGVVLMFRGDLEGATASCRRGISLKPGYAKSHYHLGEILGFQNKLNEAAQSYKSAIAINPNFPEAHNNLGHIYLRQGRPEDALREFMAAVAAKPDYAEAHNNSSIALGMLDRLEDAITSCRRAIAINPNYVSAYNNLGTTLQKQSNLEEAEASYRKALSLKSDFTEAQKNLGLLLCERGRIAEGLAFFMRRAELVYGRSPSPTVSAPAYKIRHDAEQRAWLGDQIAGFHIGDGSRVRGPAVNPNNRVEEISDQWRTAKPQIVCVDDFLTAEALQRLRAFCLESTIWREIYDGGYLGALPEHGFAPQLLAQIADELRAVYPAIIRDHPLLHFWAFKYDSSLSGIKRHADFAAVNINFWITPDEANLDPASGGLVIWDAAAPADWDFEKYNASTQDIDAFLQQAGARSVTVPYKANRAVIFDSDLFHETDRIRFKSGYENRRINITLLFGRRNSQDRTSKN